VPPPLPRWPWKQASAWMRLPRARDQCAQRKGPSTAPFGAQAATLRPGPDLARWRDQRPGAQRVRLSCFRQEGCQFSRGARDPLNPSRGVRRQTRDIETHELGLDVAERHHFSIYDSLIIAAALRAGCSILYTEDLSSGQRIAQLTICDPFAPG
jgi:hypothetical protein